jgi:ribosomal protein S6
MKYELCYLVGESKEQNLPKIKEEVADIISKEGGKWVEPQIEEKRKMAYKVGKEIRGIYVAQRFEISAEESEDGGPASDFLANINRKLNLYQDVLRFIIIKANELPELRPREERNGRAGEGRKPAYTKKETIHSKAVKEEKVAEEKKVEKPVEELVPAKEEKKEGKSIDEKIDEILNI